VVTAAALVIALIIDLIYLPALLSVLDTKYNYKSIYINKEFIDDM
jgi:hypothetical protein